MKKIILIIVALTLPILSQADPNPEDSTRVLWKVEPGANISGPAKFSADGQYIINTAYYAWNNGTIIKNAVQKRSAETGEVLIEKQWETPGHFRSLKMSHDGKYILASKRTDTTLTVLDQNSLEILKQYKVPSKLEYDKENYPGYYWEYEGIFSTAISPDGNQVVVGAHYSFLDDSLLQPIMFFDINSDKMIKYFRSNSGLWANFQYSPDGEILLSYIGDRISLMNPSNFELLKELKLEDKSIRRIKFSPNGKLLEINCGNILLIYSIEEDKIVNEYNLDIFDEFFDCVFTSERHYLFISQGSKVEAPYLYEVTADKLYSILPELGKELTGRLVEYKEDRKLLLITQTTHIILLKVNIEEIITGIEDKLEIENTLYPNPGNSEVTLEFHLNSSSSVQLEVSDLTGTTVKRSNIGFYKKGNNKIKLNITDYAPGTYFISLITQNEKLNYKLIKS